MRRVVLQKDGTGKRYTHKLEANEDARGVACRLTKQLRLALRGESRPLLMGFAASVLDPAEQQGLR
jgi:hypothetical protein